MGKQGILTLLLGIAVGACIVQAIWLADAGTPRFASGQTVDAANGWVMGSGQLQGKGQADGLYLWDTENKKLMIYFVNGETLKLLHVRDCSHDGKPTQYGKQDPSVKKMKELKD